MVEGALGLFHWDLMVRWKIVVWFYCYTLGIHHKENISHHHKIRVITLQEMSCTSAFFQLENFAHHFCGLSPKYIATTNPTIANTGLIIVAIFAHLLNPLFLTGPAE